MVGGVVSVSWVEGLCHAAVYLFRNHAAVSVALLQVFFLGDDNSCVERFIWFVITLYDLMLTWLCTVAFVHRFSPLAGLMRTVSPGLSSLYINCSNAPVVPSCS